jgi:GT2 family glycosyltransferase
VEHHLLSIQVMPQLPDVSFIVVNYNGLNFLKQSLPSILQQKSTLLYEVLLVDNCSTDGSVTFVSEHFPSVIILRQEDNLGFAGGCRVGFEASRGKFLAVVNNDAVLVPTWLQSGLSALDQERVGAVASHTVLFYSYVDLILQFPTPVSRLELVPSNLDFAAPVFVTPWEVRSVWRCQVPVRDLEDEVEIQIDLIVSPSFSGEALLRVREGKLASLRVRNGVGRINTTLVRESAFQLVQNAGLLLLPDGSGRDRGTYVTPQGLFYFKDGPVWEQPKEIFGACGVAALYRREALEQVDFFDPWYFAYYEDLDLAWRMRLHGWRAVYQPQARVRHVHCGTSKEWSPLFRYYVQRNRLATALRNGWATWALGVVIREFLNHLRDAVKHRRFRHYWRVWRDLILHLPALLRARSVVPSWHKEEILEWMRQGELESERERFA